MQTGNAQFVTVACCRSPMPESQSRHISCI